MGNRAIITTKTEYEKNRLGIYLHWNGGRDSVTGFTKYCKLFGHRDPESDQYYALGRLAQVIGNFLRRHRVYGFNPA